MTGPFEEFKAHGYTRLIPVIPGNASRASARSRLGLNGAWEKNRGKMPGTLWADGGWGGLQDWQNVIATDADLAAWQAMGANVGLQLDDGLLTVDIDIDDEEMADDIERIALDTLGVSPCRIGRWPHRMLFYRLAERVNYTSWRIGANALVECQSKGRQVVLYGVHTCGKDYEWRRKPVPRDALTLVTPEAWSAWVSALSKRYPLTEAAGKDRHVDRALIDQNGLKGDLADVRRAVEALPNTREAYPDRADYIRMAYAIKAALPDDREDAYEIWTDWAGRYEHAKPEDWPKDWRTSTPPFEIGANWIFDEAVKRSGGAFTRDDAFRAKAKTFFDDLGPAPEAAPAKAEKLYRLWTIEDLEGQPEARWLIARHIPRVSMGFLYSEPGVGKSFLAADMGLTLAAGMESWHGDAIDAEEGRRCVVYIAAEGSYGFTKRITAWRNRQGLDKTAEARLKANFFVLGEAINFTRPEDVERLVASIRGVGRVPCLVVVDTVSRSLPGVDENLQKDMTVFVDACDAVKAAFGCAVLAVHHAGKSGVGMRGSSVLGAAGDFVFRLRREKGSALGEMTCEKQKDGPDGWKDYYAFMPVTIASKAAWSTASSMVVSRSTVAPDGFVEVSGQDADILKAMREAWDAGRPWTPSSQGRDRYALKRLMEDFGLLRKDAEQKMRDWVVQRVLTVGSIDGHVRMRGYKVASNYGQPVLLTDLFG